MSNYNHNVDQSCSLERLDDFRCNLDGIVLDSYIPENTSGAFGDLFTGTHPTEGKLALKRPRGDLYNARAVAAIEIEASVWKRLRHPCILQFLGIYTIEDSVYFVSPYAENGSLPEFIQRRPEVDRKRLILEITEGLVYLHQCAIVHGDLKGNNVLISKAEHVLICDFGLAKHVTSRTATSLRGVGSLPWQSPEMLQNAGKKTFESDVYAFGITIYEVLSGKEPYSHHLGLFSLINGVILAGERPPKDPSTGSDGSSYLQFWGEAERCWDGDPTRRPSVVSVLRRLDPRRFEVLVTSQQISLEKSLDVDDQEQTHSQGAKVLPPFSFEGELLEPVQLARRIQVRMHGLHNMRRPINQLSTETIACIILEASPVASLLDTEAYVAALTSWARLRTVCKALCRAMDNTPEFWRHIWVHRGGHNMAHIHRLNVAGPLRCLITDWETDSLLGNETLQDILNLISELRCELDIGDMSRWRQAWFSSTDGGYPNLSSLTMIVPAASKDRTNPISHPATPGSNGAPPTLVLRGLTLRKFDPKSFRWVRVLKISNIVVSDSFVQDVCAFIRIAGNINELYLQSITLKQNYFDTNWDFVWEIPKVPVENSPLRIVSLVGLDSSLAVDFLYRLLSYPLKVLEVDNLEPRCLTDPWAEDSAIAKRFRLLLPTGETSTTVKRRVVYVNLKKLSGLVMGGNGEGWKLDSARFGFSTKQASDRTHLVHRLAALGIRALFGNNMFEAMTGMRDSTSLSHAKVLIVERSRAERALRDLTLITQPALTWVQYSCPLLEQIILMDSEELELGRTFNRWGFGELWRFVTWHQDRASNEESRIAKLKRLGLPSDWIEQIDHDRRSWLGSQGIEVCDTSDDEFMLSLGP